MKDRVIYMCKRSTSSLFYSVSSSIEFVNSTWPLRIKSKS